MKKLLFAFFVLLASQAQAQTPFGWFTNGVITNPAANAILADSGAFPSNEAGDREFYFVFSCSAACVIQVEHVTSGGSVVIIDSQTQSFVVPLAALSNYTFPQRLRWQAFAVGDHLRIRNLTLIAVGSVQGGIQF